jgi:hypothetical protein
VVHVFALAIIGSSAPARADVTKAECIDANGSAQQLRREGKLSGARELLRKCSDPSCPGLVRDDCSKRLDEVERMQPTIVFEVKDAAGTDLTAVSVSVDGVRIARELGGTALPVDPGAHTFTFGVVGRAPVVRQFVLHEGEKARTERIVIGGQAQVPAPAQTPEPPAVSGPSASPTSSPSAPLPPEPQSSTGAGDGRRTLGLVGAGVGAAGLVAGAVFGALSWSAHSSYEQDCGSNIHAPTGQCTEAGVRGESDAATKGTWSTVFFASGGALVATGAILFFTAPKSHHVQVGAGAGMVGVRGLW